MYQEKSNPVTAKQPAPTGMMAWLGLCLALVAVASLCISFVSPYWIQTWPLSESEFKNMGLWHVCFHNYMQFKDDSQEVYSGCWWVFDGQPKYYKLREWLTPPWFITCQVLVVGCLIILITTCLIVFLVFLHMCPIMNHEYLQTYGMFSAGSLMILVTLITIVVALIFGIQTNDRYWLPRPDLNYLSWGYGFLIITGIFSAAAGICLYKEAHNVYNTLLEKEDEYTKAALEMSTLQLDPMNNPPGYDISQAGYAPHVPMEPPNPYGITTGYGPGPAAGYGPTAGYGPSASYGPAASYGPTAGYGPTEQRQQPLTSTKEQSFAGKSFQLRDDGDDFV